MAKHRADEREHQHEHNPGHTHGHEHTHEHEHGELPEDMGVEFWDALYSEREARWSGNANPQLENEAGRLAPGRALEIGAGEGADAIWLADHGWDVTALDISQVALDRARGHAGDRDITWLQADLLEWTPPAEGYDLVTAHYFHLREPDRTKALRNLASAVAVGGTFLFVGHAPGHMKDSGPHAELLQSPEEVLATIAAADDKWETVAIETRTRPAVDHPSGETELTDAVVVLRRIN